MARRKTKNTTRKEEPIPRKTSQTATHQEGIIVPRASPLYKHQEDSTSLTTHSKD